MKRNLYALGASVLTLALTSGPAWAAPVATQTVDHSVLAARARQGAPVRRRDRRRSTTRWAPCRPDRSGRTLRSGSRVTVRTDPRRAARRAAAGRASGAITPWAAPRWQASTRTPRCVC